VKVGYWPTVACGIGDWANPVRI